MSAEEIQESVEDVEVENAEVSANLAEKEPEQALTVEECIPVLEAMLLANGEPLGLDKMVEILPAGEVEIGQALEAIRERFAGPESGFELVRVAEQYQLRTKAAHTRFVSELKAGKPRRLSAPALETLAIIAYRQPIVKADIEQIRGVDATPTLKTLLDRNIIKIVGHKPGVGQPALYGTTEVFLKLFSLESLSQLPTLRDLKELEADPGETEDEAVASEETISSEPGIDLQ